MGQTKPSPTTPLPKAEHAYYKLIDNCWESDPAERWNWTLEVVGQSDLFCKPVVEAFMFGHVYDTEDWKLSLLEYDPLVVGSSWKGYWLDLGS